MTNLPAGWISVDSSEERRVLLAELRRELPVGHCLEGLSLQALGQSEKNDDVLFVHRGASERVYVVHLTWKTETHPDWPHTSTFASLKDFLDSWREDD